MMELENRHYFAVIAILLVGVSGAFLASQNSNEPADQPESNFTEWKEFGFEEVSSGEEFTISELDKPVLVETFAVWCPTCTRQQQELKKLHEETDVTSVSLDVDQNEDAEKVRNHKQRHGFDWRYAISPLKITRSMVTEFDSSIANPPSAPMILVCEDGVRKLPNGVKPVSKLKQEIEKGC